jgi:hypothetical protein
MGQNMLATRPTSSSPHRDSSCPRCCNLKMDRGFDVLIIISIFDEVSIASQELFSYARQFTPSFDQAGRVVGTNSCPMGSPWWQNPLGDHYKGQRREKGRQSPTSKILCFKAI